jgi:branched-chain amino acid transport system substrate-binding protein
MPSLFASHSRFYFFSLLCLMVALLASCDSRPPPKRLYSSPEVYQSVLLNKSEAEVVDEDAPPAKVPDDGKIKVALLIPLTGGSTGLGDVMLNAAELALFDIGDPNIEVLPFDTQGTAYGAKVAVTEAIKNNVKLILGPIYSEEAEAAAPIAARAGVNIIAFSNNRKLTEKGVFLLGFMPEQQIERVLEFARGQSMEHYSALVTDDEFGYVTLDAFKRTLGRHAIAPSTIGFYDAVGKTLSTELKEVDKSAAVTKNMTKPDTAKTHALLVPEGGRNAMTIAARLYRHGTKTGHVRLLGSGQWDDELLLEEPKLNGSWFATSPPKQRELFESHFKEVYGFNPIRIASLAYDGIALAALLAQNDDFSKSALLSPRGFSGVNGVFRFNKDGSSERALAIIEIRGKQFEEIDPAPSTFERNDFGF